MREADTSSIFGVQTFDLRLSLFRQRVVAAWHATPVSLEDDA
jgi:hypothetical protein